MVWLALERAIYGRWISVIGQNLRAARLAGVPTDLVRAVTYVTSAVLAALAGFLLASFSGRAALNIGAEYLLVSVAVVAIVGASIGGGRSNVPGIWDAALFMFLIVSLRNSYGLGAGMRLMVAGVIITAIVAAGSFRGRT